MIPKNISLFSVNSDNSLAIFFRSLKYNYSRSVRQLLFFILVTNFTYLDIERTEQKYEKKQQFNIIFIELFTGKKRIKKLEFPSLSLSRI